MDLVNLIMFVYIALIILFFVKAVSASARRRNMQSRSNTTAQQKSMAQKNYTYTQPVRKTQNSGSEYINTERRKEYKKKFTLFGKREPDCDLDERYFGSKNANKDLW